MSTALDRNDRQSDQHRFVGGLGLVVTSQDFVPNEATDWRIVVQRLVNSVVIVEVDVATDRLTALLRTVVRDPARSQGSEAVWTCSVYQMSLQKLSFLWRRTTSDTRRLRRGIGCHDPMTVHSLDAKSSTRNRRSRTSSASTCSVQRGEQTKQR